MADTFSVDVPVPDPSQFRTYDESTWDVERCKREFVDYLLQEVSDFRHLEACERAMTRLDCWRECFEHIADLPTDPILGRGLLTFWRGSGLAPQSGVWKEYLFAFLATLRRHLPLYRGPGRTLYRGQLQARHELEQYGIAWTESLEKAHDFARYHATTEGNTVILRAEVPAQQIIGPLVTELTGSLDEREFIVDPRGLQPEVLETVQDHRVGEGGEESGGYRCSLWRP